MHVPALVTTGQLSDPHPGALGESTTQILFGDSRLLNDLRAGGRLQAGMCGFPSPACAMPHVLAPPAIVWIVPVS